MATTISGDNGIDKVVDGSIVEADIANASVTVNKIASNAVSEAKLASGLYVCKAWVNFNGTGTVAIRASGNVTSITDNGVGQYTINFTTAMPDANYSLVGTCHGAGGATFQIDSSVYSTTACYVLTRVGGTATDTSIVNAAVLR